MARRKRTPTEVECCSKYILFAFNVLFWLLGALIFSAGIYAWVEKGIFSKLESLSGSVFFDPAAILMVVGAIVFIISFCGCVGALRENTMLLFGYMTSIALIFLAILGAALYLFIARNSATDTLKRVLTKTIVAYEDDPDLKDLINWVQADWLHCCGVDGVDDWEVNEYFNCSSMLENPRRCAVPWSCCDCAEPPCDRMCGYSARDPDNTNPSIYTDGCFVKFNWWINNNVIPLGATAAAIAIAMLISIYFAQNLRGEIFLQKAKWKK